MAVRPGNDEGLRRAAVMPSLLLLLGTGCLNLDLPTVPPTPPPPYLTVVTPKPGDVIGLSSQVSVTAASVYGITDVSVLCGPPDGGPRTIQVWTAPPYAALVDFSLCQGLTGPNPDGGYPLLQLQVVAQSDAGIPQQAALEVAFNTVGPVLSIQYPPSAQPKAPFTVQVTSNTALSSFPVVTLDSQPATSVTVTQAGPQPTYNVFFQSAPGLGTDNTSYTPGVPVPIEVLTDTERTVRLLVSATAANGNGTQLDLGVDLTRVVWDRYIPGRPASTSPIDWAAEPVAFDGGLILPLATANPASATSVWIPGLLGQADGTFYGFQTSQLPGGLDGGYVARGLNARGQTLFFDFTGNGSNLLLASPSNSAASNVTATGGPPVANAPLTRVDDLLCLQDSVAACSTDAGIESLTCFDPQLNQVTTSSGLTFTGPPTPGVVAGGGGRYLSPNVGVCGSSWNLVDITQGKVSFGPTAEPPGCAVQSISKLLSVGDGTFVVQLISNCSITGVPVPVYPILRVGAGSAILGSYMAPLGSPSHTQAEVVGALADGRVVTVSNAPPYTTFELWALNATTPDVISPIAGLYDTEDATLASVLPLSTYSGADGSFAVLLSGATLGVGVLAFAPNLQPRWLYVYPRTTLSSSTRLVSAASFPEVYLVDEFNEYAVSLQVGASLPGGGPSDAGPDGGAALRTINGSEMTIYQPPGLPQTIITPDLSTASISVSLLDAGVYGSPIQGVGFNNGNFNVAGLPTAGNYLLNLGAGTSYWIPDDTLPLLTLGAGRADVIPFNFANPSDATITATLTNLTSWNSNDVLEAVSLGANDFVNDLPAGCNPAPAPAAGTTFLNGGVFSVKNSPCGAANTIEGSKGDVVVIAQLSLQQTSTGVFYLSLSSYFEPAPFNLSDGQNVSVAGPMVTVNQNQTLNCDFRLSQFVAATQIPAGGFTNAGIQYGVNVEGSSIPTSQGLPFQPQADFLSFSPPSSTTDQVSGQMTYGIPAGYPFFPYGFISYFPNVGFAFPGTSAGPSTVRYAGMQVITPVGTLCSGPVVPTLTPVRAITLNGADASQALTGVGLTPLVAWSAPAVGTPSRYTVTVTQFYVSGVTTLGTVVGSFTTRDLSLRLPPGVLSSGKTYSLEIVADDSVAIGDAFHVLGEGTAGALSNTFVP